jgi:hypothetical protein
VDGDPEKSKKIYTVETLDMPANNLPQKDDISASGTACLVNYANPRECINLAVVEL